MRKIGIGIALAIAAFVAVGAYVEYNRVCCAPSPVPFERYWADHLKSERDRIAAQPAEQRE